jgi:O-methyltransferase involved in polyketide biosynthesis
MTNARDAKIAPTAYYTSYVWKRLGLPHADLFATAEGAALFWGFRAAGEWIAVLSPHLPSMTQYLALRHRLIEARLAALRPDRVVEIGAGLSRRGITWALDHGVDYVEVDLPDMIAAKRARLLAAGPRMRAVVDMRLRLESRDALAPDFGAWLAATLSGAERPVVIAEGVLGYFPLPERLAVVGSIRESLARAGGGSFLCDIRSREGGAAMALAATVLRSGIRLVTRGRGVREDFVSVDAVRAFFREAGFTAEPVPRSLVPELAQVPSPMRVWEAVARAPSA